MSLKSTLGPWGQMTAIGGSIGVSLLTVSSALSAHTVSSSPKKCQVSAHDANCSGIARTGDGQTHPDESVLKQYIDMQFAISMPLINDVGACEVLQHVKGCNSV